MRRVLAGLIFLFALSAPALAQNVTCPNVPFGNSSQRCANTKFVQDAVASVTIPALPNGRIFVGNASNVATAVALSGDCTIIASGAITCTKTGGVAFGPFATGTDAANLTGTIASARLSGSYTGITNVGTLAGLIVTGSFTATGLVTNADLVSPSITVNGVTCTLGAGCTITAAASSIAVGTPLIGGTNLRVLYDNASTVGEYTNAQLTALINPATGSLSGALPAFPNTTTTFFRGDGTYVTLNCAALSGVATSCATDATNASNIASGTLPNGRLTGAYTGITGLGTIAGLTVTGSLTATGLVTNADLVNPGLTLGSTALTLGTTTTSISGLTLTASAFNGTVGATTPSTGVFTTLGVGTAAPYTSLEVRAVGPNVLALSGPNGSATRSIVVDTSGLDVNTSITAAINFVDVGAFSDAITFSSNHTGSIGTTQTENARITSDGLFGLGTPSPTAQFHNTGSVRFAGLSGTGTQCLTLDATGNAGRGACSGGGLPNGGIQTNLLIKNSATNGDASWYTASCIEAAAYGVTGDGSTNDAPAIQAILTAIQSAGKGCVRFPCGLYKMNSLPTIANAALAIFGGGAGCTRFMVNNSSGFLSATFDQTLSTNYAITLADFDVVCASGGNCGIGIAITGSNTASPTWVGEPQVYIRNVRVVSTTPDASTEQWTKGIAVIDMFEIMSYGYGWYQVGNTTGVAFDIPNSNNNGTYGFYAKDTVMQGGCYGFRVTGWFEDVQIDGGELVTNCYSGYFDGHLRASNTNPDLHIKGLHMAGGVNALFVSNWNVVILTGNDFFKYNGTTNANIVVINNSKFGQITGNKWEFSGATGFAGLNMDNVQEYTITGNNFTFEGPYGAITLSSNVAQTSSVLLTGNKLKTTSGGTDQAYYINGTDKVTFCGNMDIGWTTQFGGSGNTNFSTTCAGSTHY